MESNDLNKPHIPLEGEVIATATMTGDLTLGAVEITSICNTVTAAGERPGVDLQSLNIWDNASNDTFDIYTRALDHLRAFGLDIDHIEAHGNIVRCTIQGRPHKGRDGWYVAHRMGNHLVINYGDWRENGSHTWKSYDDSTLSPGEVADLQRIIEQRRQQAEAAKRAKHEAASNEARALVNNLPSAAADHPYLLTKHIQPENVLAHGDQLIIPVCDTSGRIWSYQRIFPAGDKRFLSDGRVQGHFAVIGSDIAQARYLVEGYATGATLRHVTHETIIVCFYASNLLPVLQSLRAAGCRQRLTIAADNDRFGKKNIGIDAAKAACQAVADVDYMAPQFQGDKGTDFNDLAAIEGSGKVYSQLCPGNQQVKVNNVEPPKVVSFTDLLSEDLPPLSHVLLPWLPEQGLAMLYAPRGVGKTFVALHIGYAVATGGQFLKWQAPEPQPVLYIDGEMSQVVMQQRFAQIVKMYGDDNRALLSENYRLITPDRQPRDRAMIDLSTALGQQAMEPLLDGVKLLIIDNISTLCRQGAENEAESWLAVQGWILALRARGITVLLVHHAGKGGNQRGTSKREDVLDTVIALRHPRDYNPDMGAAFEIHFEKARGFHGSDAEPLDCRLVTTGADRASWTWRPLEKSVSDKVIDLVRDGLSQAEIAAELDINKSTVSRHVKKAKENGLLEIPQGAGRTDFK